MASESKRGRKIGTVCICPGVWNFDQIPHLLLSPILLPTFAHEGVYGAGVLKNKWTFVQAFRSILLANLDLKRKGLC